MAEWLRACDVNFVPDHEGRCVRLGNEDIAIFKVDGEFFALADHCPHGDGRLSEGWVESGEVECPLHQSRFNLVTGAVQCPPARDDARFFQIRCDGENVMVQLGD